MNKLHVDSVIKSFGTKQVLTDVFISCQKGEIVGLLGRNGTGKSTLLKIIFGSMPADNRFVKIGDKLSTGLFSNRNLIQYLPQDNFLPNHVKVKTIIDLFCDVNKAELVKAHELIAPMLNKRSKQLSGGEKRLLEILLMIYSDSAYTLIDEPFNGVAPIYKDDIKELIKKRSVDKGFIITDHDYRNILDLATRIVIIHDGGIKEIKGIDDLKYWGYIPETD
jgi:ABC-type multidrug transport system ATPase subunit